MPRPGTVIDFASAQIFLTEAAKYFANRPTGGEDRAYWANVYNSENCTKTLELIGRLRGAIVMGPFLTPLLAGVLVHDARTKPMPEVEDGDEVVRFG